MSGDATELARVIKRAGAALVDALSGGHGGRGGEPAGLRPAHGRVFEVIDPDGTRLTVLAERAGMTHQAMGDLVDDLIGTGYLERVPDPGDGRARLIRPTAYGHAQLAAAAAAMAALRADWQRRLDGITAEQVIDGLRAFIAACEEFQASGETGEKVDRR